MADRDSGGFGWFLAGLGVGAVVGILYAPKSGEETREVLRAKAQEGTEKAKQHARRAKEQASEWADRGREVVNQQKDQFRSAYEAGRDVYNEKTTATSSPTKNL